MVCLSLCMHILNVHACIQYMHTDSVHVHVQCNVHMYVIVSFIFMHL